MPGAVAGRMPIDRVISRAVIFLVSLPAGKKLPTSVARLSALQLQWVLPGVGNICFLPPGEKRKMDGGVNVFNSPGLQEGAWP